MSRINLIIIIGIFFGLILLFIFILSNSVNWLIFNWLDIIYAAIMAIIVGLVLDYIYKKYSAKSKMQQTTLTPPSKIKKSMAKLILKDKHEFIIDEYERIFGREDFIGISVPDDLLYIGKEHFKIIKKEDGFYIEDLNTKNGTLLNRKEIKGLGSKKLENNDDILVAKVLKIKYIEEKP